MVYRKETKVVRRYPKRKKATKKKSDYIPFLLGPKHVCKLRYGIEDGINITSTSGSFAHYAFEVTSLYDPNKTGTGHQPRGFDQLMTMFDHFQVIGAKFTCKLVAINEQATQQPTMVYLVLNDSQSALTSRSEAVESRYMRERCITQDDRMVSMIMPFSAKKFFGRGKGILNDKQLQGSAAANPVENAYMHVCAETVNAGGTATVNIMGHIDFVCVFSEPRRPPQS